MSSSTDHAGLKVAYIMSRFPKLTETFVLYEIIELIEHGIDVQIYPLLREREKVTHPDVARVNGRVRFALLFSASILKANIRCMVRRPGIYFRTLAEVLGGTLGSLNFFLGAIGSFPKAVLFAEQMQRERVQHVHAHFANHPALAALIVHRLTGIPFSFTAHGSDLLVERRMLTNKIRASRFAVAISNYNRELMVREAGEEQRNHIHVIHCGIDPETFTAERTLRSDDSLHIVCVGALAEHKGQWVLIEACRTLCEAGIDVHCDLIGNGSWHHRLMRQVHDLGLDEVVTFNGSRSRPEVIKLVAQSDVMVLASVPMANGKAEGIPVALMEAMALGVPVISTRITGIPELISDGVSGFLVPPRDALALSAALQKVYADPTLREMFATEGRKTVAAHFNLRTEAAKLSHLFELSAKSTRRPAAKVYAASSEQSVA